MEKSEILNTLKGIIKPYLEKPEYLDNFKEDSNLLEELRVDWVDLVEIVLDIDEAFEIQIEDHLIREMKTPKYIMELIQEET